MAAGARLVASHSRRLRHLPQHSGLSGDGPAARAAAAAVDRVHASRTARDNPLTLANGFSAAPTLHGQHLCGRSRISASATRTTGRLLGPARSAGVADHHRRPISGRRGRHLLQEFLPNTYPIGGGESVSGLPGRICLPDLERHLAPRRGAGPVAAAAAQRPQRVGCSTRSRRRPTMPQPRSPAQASTAARSRRTGAISTPSAAPSNFDQRHLLTAAVPVHDRHGHRRRRARRPACADRSSKVGRLRRSWPPGAGCR